TEPADVKAYLGLAEKILGTVALAEAAPPAAGVGPALGKNYLEERKAHATKLVRKGPSPQKFAKETPPAGVKEVTYRSGTLELKAWFALPEKPKDKVFALVYFHGEFS